MRSLAGKTIGDICKTDMEVLKAYTGDSMATYTSHCGLSFRQVAEDISDDINGYLSKQRHNFIREHEQEVVESFDYEIESLFSRKPTYVKRKDFDLPLNDIGYDYITDFMIDDAPHFEWFVEQFPEYLYDDEFVTNECVFYILG